MERAILAALDEDPLPPLDYPLGRRFHRPMLEARWLLAPRNDRDAAWRLPAIVRPWDVSDLLSVTDPLPFAAGLRRMAIRSRQEFDPRSDRLRRRRS